MKPRPLPIGIIAVIVGGLAAAPAGARQESGLAVRVEGLPPGPHYVGQAIPVRVRVAAGATEPVVSPPEHPAVDVIAAGVEVRPVSAGAIGSLVVESNLYQFEFLLVPRAAGPLVLPPFRAVADGQSGASGPTRLDPRQPPAFGRPAWFLGGIGTLDVELVARPESVLLGESAEVEVRLLGLGALGSTTRPALKGPDGAPLGARVEALPPTVSDSPPARIFPFRIRPSIAGRTTIAPVLVSWFDPVGRGYRTVGSRGVTIRVDDPPAFDPRALVFSADPDVPDGRASAGSAAAVAAVLGLGVVAGAAFVAVRAGFRARDASAGRYAARRSAALAAVVGPRRAELTIEALAGYLLRATGRPEGALTPPEAHSTLLEATGDADLADRAARLVAACDAARFSGRLRPDGANGVGDGLDDAPALFRDLARADRPARGRMAE